MLLSALATEAGKTDTVCWSSTQHGISGSVSARLVPDVESDVGCACDFRTLRRPAVVSASVG